uniref:Macaca fascicularis brain cDNA clone: QflA-16549, similar to human M-phase phosphoprotein, mpp8 (HSMPP8), mRNA, RefSeq: NM_017520.2 n=1 Tax=Macaca fascicularis TaxID=9541 RepID=I7G534_MACFA|nr:unnamed protein product [Macaca fascicularis]
MCCSHLYTMRPKEYYRLTPIIPVLWRLRLEDCLGPGVRDQPG